MKRSNIVLSRTGASEIIGALMLTLIVVAAATSFFVFLSDQQEDYQANENKKSRIENEAITVSGFSPYLNAAETHWDLLRIDISSEWLHESTINSIQINDIEVKQIWSYDPTSWDPATPSTGISVVQLADKVELGERDILNYLVFLDQTADFYDSSDHTIPITKYVKIEITTDYRNTFSESYIPPTAILNIETDVFWDASVPGFQNMIVFDGSESEHTTEDAYIVEWKWESRIDSDGTSPWNYNTDEFGYSSADDPLYGEKVRADNDFDVTGQYHEIRLTVTDNYGMQSIEIFEYYY